MLKWLLGSKEKKVEAGIEEPIAPLSLTAIDAEPTKVESNQEKKPLRPCTGISRSLNRSRVVSIEPAKAGDELVTINPHYKDPRWKHEECGCKPEQYLLSKDGNWYFYPDFIMHGTGFDRLYAEYKVRKVYETETPLMIAIQSRQSEVKCIYCHSQLQAKAQVCLKCGGFLCLACAPTVEKCPTLGCQ